MRALKRRSLLLPCLLLGLCRCRWFLLLCWALFRLTLLPLLLGGYDLPLCCWPRVRLNVADDEKVGDVRRWSRLNEIDRLGSGGVRVSQSSRTSCRNFCATELPSGGNSFSGLTAPEELIFGRSMDT